MSDDLGSMGSDADVGDGNLDRLAARVVAMCEKRGWSLHWTERGTNLHLEASELIEAIRGKGGDPTDEAGDVLLVLMSITGSAGIAFSEVLARLKSKLALLEQAAPYPGEGSAGPPITAMAWVARDRTTGNVCAVCDADPQYADDAAGEIAQWKRDGATVSLMTKAQAKAALAITDGGAK